MRTHTLGIYEKALPKDLSWTERLAVAKACGFDFVEISIDESDTRLERLKWNASQRLALVEAQLATGIFIPSMCLSGHRRYPFGSHDGKIRQQAYQIMEDAILFAADIGIHTIQLAGYDVYYEKEDVGTKERFIEGLKWAVKLAAAHHIMLAIEIMDTSFLNSITKWKEYEKLISSPWFAVYPDIGNLSAWNNNVIDEISLGLDKIVAFHLKDTYKVTKTCKGQFRDVPFGEGCVDFISFFHYLSKVNYRGAFMIEMWTEKLREPLLEIINARHFIESKMQQGGFIC